MEGHRDLRKCVVCGEQIMQSYFKDRLCMSCADDLEFELTPYKYDEIDPWIIDRFEKNRKSRKRRECLSCGRQFNSRGIQHRICGVCKKKKVYIDPHECVK